MALKATVAGSSPVLKRLYPDGVEKVIYKASRLFERCKKQTNFTNEDMAVVVRISGTSGGSANFADALASQGQSQKARFLVGRKKEYQLWSVDGEAVAATDGNPKAIVNIVRDEMSEALYKFGRTMARRITGKGGGSLGTISTSTTLASTTLVFDEPNSTQWVEVGDYIQLAENDGTSSSADPATDLRGSGTALQITAVNRATNSVTVNANVSTITGAAHGDNIFRRGDYSRAMTGLEGWLPIADPSSDLFFNLNRTLYDIARVSGFRYTAGAGKSYQSALIEAGAQASTHGINDLDALYMSAYDFGEFEKEIGSQRLRDADDSKVGYQFIEINTPMAASGKLKVISEPGLRQGYAWGIKDSLLECNTAGPNPNTLAHGLGNKGMLMPQDDDAIQGRLGAYGNNVYRNPGMACIIQFVAS